MLSTHFMHFIYRFTLALTIRLSDSGFSFLKSIFRLHTLTFAPHCLYIYKKNWRKKTYFIWYQWPKLYRVAFYLIFNRIKYTSKIQFILYTSSKKYTIYLHLLVVLQGKHIVLVHWFSRDIGRFIFYTVMRLTRILKVIIRFRWKFKSFKQSF